MYRHIIYTHSPTHRQRYCLSFSTLVISFYYLLVWRTFLVILKAHADPMALAAAVEAMRSGSTLGLLDIRYARVMIALAHLEEACVHSIFKCCNCLSQSSIATYRRQIPTECIWVMGIRRWISPGASKPTFNEQCI